MARKTVKQRLSIIIFSVILILTAWLSLSNDHETKESYNFGELLEVHFIDVGQADCILIQQGESAILIDAGNNNDSDMILDYLKKEEIDNLDFIVGTHPHEDHIGGLDKIIEKVDVETIFLPDVISDTKTFEEVVTAIKSNKRTLTMPSAGQIYSMGNIQLTIMSPANKKYSELNDFSIAIRMVYGDHSFLFLGDCEILNENEMLESGLNLDSDVIKIGHHGSDSSSSIAFLEAVKPEYAVISVGKGNDYNHPAESVLNRLDELDIDVLRTDLQGTIVFTTDGNTLTVRPPPAF